MSTKQSLTGDKVENHDHFGVNIRVCAQWENDLISEPDPTKNQTKNNHAPSRSILEQKIQNPQRLVLNLIVICQIYGY